MLLLAACQRAPAPPAEPEPPAFVGSAACAGCHDDQVREWQGSHHDLAMQTVTASTVLGDFNDATFQYHDTTTRFHTDNDRFLVTTTDVPEAQAETTFEIAYVFGVEPLQQYLIAFPGGRYQTLPYAWDTRPASAGGQRWFHLYEDQHIAPDDELHWTGRQLNWNYQCAECHSTNLEVNYDLATDTFATTYDEIDVACEACHGPASQHVEQARAYTFDDHHGLPADLSARDNAAWVMNLETGIAALSRSDATHAQQAETCARCHSRRGVTATHYEYGQPLLDTHRLALVTDPQYFDDGQIQEEVYVYGSFLQSRMHAAGVTCTDCHNPHSLELVTGPDPNDVCAQCHLPDTFAVPAHSGHTTDDAGCVDCHMPERTYMVVDPRRDHSFRVPRPELSATTNAPNACQNCHDEVVSAEADVDHFAHAFAAARNGYANAELMSVIHDPSESVMVRASAIARLAAPIDADAQRAIRSALSSEDALMRLAGVQALPLLSPDDQLGFRDLLKDPVRTVRIDAARALAPLSRGLPSTSGFPAAAQEYRQSLEAIGSQPDARVALADFALATGDARAALAAYESALSIDAGSTLARVNFVDALRAVGDEARAEAVLRDGLALNSKDADLHYALGLLMVRTERSSAAVGQLQTAASLAPGNARYAYVLAIAQRGEGLREASLATLENAHQQFPRDYDIGTALITAYQEIDERETAREVLATLTAVYPVDPGLAMLERALDAAP